jgi:hypothetical protein
MAVSEITALLLGCVKKKLEHEAPAKDLYSSQLWKGRRGYAESTGRPWYILSARYGLVDAERLLEPYNLALSELPAVERRAWGQRVVEQLAERVSLDGAVFEVHAGSDYRTAIDEPLRRRGAR